MAGTAQAAERIRCDRCSGHYVVDAASDGSPRVRCNKCGHLREAAEASPASIPGKWTVIGPDGKAMSFDTWEELTESRRPSAITPTAKGMEEADHALRDLKPAAAQEKKSASALLDITPAPKLALADMDSAIDLGEPLGGPRKSRPGATTMMSGSGTGSVPSGKLEPLLVRSFSQPPKTQTSPKVEWAPKIDKSVVPPRGDQDNTLRVEVAPAALAESKPSGQERVVAPAPATTKVMEAERPTAPRGGVAADDSIDELDPDSLLDDGEEEEAAPLSLRDAIPDDASSEEELGDDDLQEDAPDPHELLSLRDLVVVPPTGDESNPEVAAAAATTAKPSQAPPPKSVAPPPKLSQAPKAAPATSQAPPAKSLPPRPKSLSRPDVPEGSLPPPTIRPPSIRPPGAQEEKAAEASKGRSSARAAVAKQEEKPNRTWMYALGGILLLGIGWRLTQSPDAPPPPPPAPTPTVATVVPPTPVTAPTATDTAPTPTATESTTAVDVPPTPTTTTTTTTTTTATTATPTPTGAIATTAKPATTETTGGTASAATPPKPTVANTDAPGSMSELLDKAGSAKRKGDFATARELYGKVIAMNPANVEANGGLGDVAKSQGDLGQAKASYERALAASPTYSPALLGLADVEWDQGNQASAKKRYAQIVDRLGDRAPARAKERSQ